MGPSKTMLLPQEGHRVLCKPLKTFLGLVKKISVFDIFLNIFGKKFNMFGIFCNNKLVKKPICLVKISMFFVKISEFLVKNPEMFVKNLRFFENMSKEEIYDDRKNKFLNIGREKGVTTASSLNEGGLGYKETFELKLKRHFVSNKYIYLSLIHI